MKIKTLTALSAIALSLQSKCIWCDVISDVQQANDSINQGAAWQESARLFINAFHNFRSSLEDAYRNCGGGGVIGLDGQRTEAAPREGWGPRGNVRSGSPIVIGCWLDNQLCCRKHPYDCCSPYDWQYGNYDPWLGLPTEMLNTFLAGYGCCCEVPQMPYYYQAVSYRVHSQEHVARYLDSCCTCDGAAIEVCCCSGLGWLRTMCEVLSCGLSRCMVNEKVITFSEYVDRCVGRPIRRHIRATLGVASLREAGEYWQLNFCQPVSELLTHICQIREVSLNEILWLLELYRCYIESDFGNTIQFSFSQTNYANVRPQVHSFIAEIFRHIDPSNPIYKFFESSVTNYDRNVYTFVDRETLPGIEIRPIGYYQIELPMLTGRDAIFGIFNLTDSNPSSSPLINLVSEKAQTIANNEKPVYNVTSQSVPGGIQYTTTYSPSIVPLHTCRNPNPGGTHIEFRF